MALFYLGFVFATDSMDRFDMVVDSFDIPTQWLGSAVDWYGNTALQGVQTLGVPIQARKLFSCFVESVGQGSPAAENWIGWAAGWPGRNWEETAAQF
jgi:hypothetical protein